VAAGEALGALRGGGDLDRMAKTYRGSGSYHPLMLLGILV
jgi:hypothetical protein